MHGSQFGGRQNSDFNSNNNQNIYLLTMYTYIITYLSRNNKNPSLLMTMEMLYLFQSVKLMFFDFSSIGAVLMLKNKRRSDEKTS